MIQPPKLTTGINMPQQAGNKAMAMPMPSAAKQTVDVFNTLNQQIGLAAEAAGSYVKNIPVLAQAQKFVSQANRLIKTSVDRATTLGVRFGLDRFIYNFWQNLGMMPENIIPILHGLHVLMSGVQAAGAGIHTASLASGAIMSPKLSELGDQGQVTEEQLKELFLKLNDCHTEEDMIRILREVGLWDIKPSDDPAKKGWDWSSYGKTRNTSVAGAQKDDPVDAMTERIMNAIDAIIIHECLVRGIDPKSPEAPQTIQEAIEKFFNIKDGNLLNATPEERHKLASRVNLILTGQKYRPCVTVYDDGEGQTPDRIPDTLLSLNATNKNDIKCVQGRFNMGSTGLFRFTGRKCTTLIISKRNPAIPGTKDNRWGFTIIKEVFVREQDRNPRLVYLTLDGKVPAFKASRLPLVPQGNSAEGSKNREVSHGTMVRHVDYSLATHTSKDPATGAMLDELGSFLTKPVLPVQVTEARHNIKMGKASREARLVGFEVRVEDNRAGDLEPGFPVGDIVHLDGIKVDVKIYAFKPGQSRKYTNGKGGVVVVNGQTHALLLPAFFARKDCGMDYLRDSIFFVVDCSRMDGLIFRDIFMGCRSRLSWHPTAIRLRNEVAAVLKNNQDLKLLKQRRKSEATRKKLKDEGPLTSALERIISQSPNLLRLLGQGNRIQNIHTAGGPDQETNFVGKQFPTEFELKRQFFAKKSQTGAC